MRSTNGDKIQAADFVHQAGRTAKRLPIQRGLLIAASVAATATTLAHIELSKKIVAAHIALQALQRPITDSIGAAQNAAVASFVERLGSAPSTDPFLNTLQTAAKGLDVKVVSMAAEHHPATSQTLGRDDLSLTLRGSYANLKRVLSEILDRHRDVVVQHLAMTHGSLPGEQDLQVTLGVLSRPSAAEASFN